MTPPIVPVLCHPHLRAWPRHEVGGPVEYVPLPDALTRQYATDAHAAAYSVPDIGRRLDTGALRELPGGVPMLLALYDVDLASHGADPSAVDAAWNEERPKVRTLLGEHPGLFVYRTRGGYRIVGVRGVPVIVRDGRGWRIRYVAETHYLRRRFGIVADPACKDWTRLYRLPHATRDPAVGPERRETIGNPGKVGTWSPGLTAGDIDAASRSEKPHSTRKPGERSGVAYTGPGLLHRLFDAHGWLSEKIDDERTIVRCPWSREHTTGADFDGSTILFAPANGETMGWFHCSHGHCTTRGVRDVLRLWTQTEIDTVRQAAGIPDRGAA